MDINAYLRPIKKWWWLLVAATVIASVTSFIATLRQPLVYQSKATLMIGQSISDPNPNTGEFYLEQQLASIYADIGNREVVRNGAMQQLGINWLPTYSVRALPNTQLIEITVTDTVPVRAQAVANELAHQLILQSPTSMRSQDQNRQSFIDEQLNTLQQQIKDTQDEIQKLNLQMGTLNSARQIADIQTQISGLETKVTNLQSAYASLAATSSKDATNSLSVIEQASLPSTPIGPQKIIVVLLAAVVGLTLAGIGVYIIEALDDTIKSTDEISRLLDVPIIGSIPIISERESRWDYVFHNPRSPITDAFRMTRANIEFLSVDRPLKTILMTSPNVSEGKSTIASNLGFCFAQNEKKVILMDADFRRPVLHTAAKVSGEKGLSDVFLGTEKIDNVLVRWSDEQVSLLPAGKLPPNPTELLGSKRMENILKDVKQKADLVIIDAPPLILADALILSKFVDGVLLVIRLGRTRKKSILTVKKQLEQAGTNILGILVNQATTGEGYYYNRYYSSEDRPGKKKTESIGKNGRNGQLPSKQRSESPIAQEISVDPNPTPPFVDTVEDVEIDYLGFPNFDKPDSDPSHHKPTVKNVHNQQKY